MNNKSIKPAIKPKSVSINAKCSDLCFAQLIGTDGKIMGQEHDGYVPEWMPGEHFGDYVEIEIDLETGKILNWKVPTEKQLNETFKFKK